MPGQDYPCSSLLPIDRGAFYTWMRGLTVAKTVDPARMAAKWKAGMAGAAQAYKDGINATNVNPMALAASPDAMQAYLNGVQRSVTSGRRAAALNAADAGYWKSQSINFGASALAMAGQKAFQKYSNAAQRIAPILNAASAAVAGMPKGGLANATARSNAALAAMMQAAGTA